MNNSSLIEATIPVTQDNKGIKSFLKYAIENEGKKYDDEAADSYINSYNGNTDQLINDVAERAGVPEPEFDAFRERAYKEFGIGEAQELVSANTSIPKIKPVSKPKTTTELLAQPPKEISLNSPLVAGKSKPPAKEDQSFLGKLGRTAWNGLNVGGSNLGSWMADVPGIIYDLAGAPFRAVGMNVPKSEDFEGGALEQVSDYYKKNAKAFEKRVEEINPGREQGIVESYANGDLQQGTLNLVGSISESLPASIAMIITGGSTLPTILGSAGVFGAAKVQELDENAPEMDYDKRRIVGVVNGTLEGVFETLLGSGAVGRSLSEIIKQSGKKEAKRQIKRSVSTMFSDMITKNPWLAPLGEGFEEVGTQISQNMVDKYTGYRPDISITEGVGDAFAAGVTMGAVHGSVIELAKKGVASKQQQKNEQLPGEPVDATPNPSDSNKTITTAEIEGQKYTILNPEDLGQKKPIFAKNEKGQRKFFQWTKVNNESIKTETVQQEMNNEGNSPVSGISPQNPTVNNPNPKISPRNQRQFESVRPETKIKPVEQSKADDQSANIHEVDMDSLSPEERFKTLVREDEQIAKEMLLFDIEELKKELTVLQKQNPDKPSTKFARLKRLKEIGNQLNELPKLLNTKAEDFETGTNQSPDAANIPINQEENRGDGTGGIQTNQRQHDTANDWDKLVKDESNEPSRSINQEAYHPETASLIGKINADEASASKRLKELKEDEKQAIVFERDEIKKQISAFKEGVRLGRSDTKTRLKNIQTAIVNYAKKNMPLDEAGQRDLGTLLTSIKNAQTPATIEKAFNKIDELTGKVVAHSERKKNVRTIERVLKWMTTYRKQGTNKHGKFTYPDVKVFTELKEIDGEVQQLSSIVNSRNASALEKQGATTRLNEIWDSINSKEDKNLLDETTLKMIELRRNGAKASDHLVQTIAEDLNTIYQSAKEAKSEEDIQRALERSEDKEFIKNFVRETKIDDKSYLSKLSTRLGNFTSNAMGNWETLLTVLGGHKARDKFSLIIDQVNQEMGIQDSFDEVLDQAYKAYGFKNKNKLLQRIQDMKQEDYTLVQPIMKGRRIEGSPLKISKMQIIDIYNTIKQPEIRNDYYMTYGDIVQREDGTFDREAQRRIGKERIDTLIDNLTEADQEFGDIMQQKVSDYYEKVNPVFVRLFNRDMPKNKNYWMSTVERTADHNIFDNYMIDSNHPGFSKGRGNRRTPKPGDAFDKFSKHVQQAEWYVNMGLPVHQLDRIFSDIEVKNLIIENRGYRFYKTIAKQLKDQGLQKSTRDLTDFERIGGNILGNWVAAKIGLTPSVPFKQLMSVINYSENMPMDEWMTGFAKGLASPKETFDEMWENIPYLRTRFKKGYSEALEYAMNAASDMPKAKNFHQAFKNFETIGTRSGDIAAIIYGGKPYVDYLINKKGLSKEEAYKQFLLDTLRSQQSPFSSTLSIFQNSKNPFARALFTFANTPSQYMRKMFEANAAYRHGDITRGQLAKTYFIYAVANQALYIGAGVLIRALLGKGWDDLEEYAKETGAQIATSLVGGIPLVRDVMNSFARETFGLRVYADNLPVLEELERAALSSSKLMSGKGDTTKYLKNFIISILELGGVGANNALRLWDATYNRKETVDKWRIDEANKKLNELSEPKAGIDKQLDGMSKLYSNQRKQEDDYLKAEAAHKLKYAYSTAKRKATRLEKEGNIANAELLRDLIEQSKAELSHSDYSYETLKEELEYVERMIELLTK